MGMGTIEFAGLFALIHAVVLLTVSFFVLLSARKTDSQALKIFGYCIAVLLWISSALVFSAGVYKMTKRHCPMMKGMMMQQQMVK